MGINLNIVWAIRVKVFKLAGSSSGGCFLIWLAGRERLQNIDNINIEQYINLDKWWAENKESESGSKLRI